MNANDIELALRTRAAHNRSVEHIDAGTRTRLREMRMQALYGESRRAPVRWAWAAGTVAAFALALLVFLPRLPRATTNTAATTTAIAQHPATQANLHQGAAMATADAAPDAFEAADPELLSNLDFYGWLAQQPGNSVSGG